MGVLGNLGGGFGEEPVRVGDLEAAARAENASEEPAENETENEKPPAQRERPRR